MARRGKGCLGGIPSICGWCDMKPERRLEEDNPGPVCDHYESRLNPYPFLFEAFCKHCNHPPKCHPGYSGFGSLGPKSDKVPIPEANRPRRKPKPKPVFFTVLAGDFYPAKKEPAKEVMLMSKKTFEGFIEDPELSAAVRLAGSAEDVEAILALGKDPSFSVSPNIRFYERGELIEWAQLREENHLLVVTLQEAIVGFCFCKVMSPHWAVLDNLYVAPEHRKKGLGRLLMWALTARLKRRKIKYLSALTHVDLKGGTTSFMRTAGFRLGNLYHWQELFLEGDQREVDVGFLGKHIPLKEEPAVPELMSEVRVDHSHDLDGRGWTDFELMRMHKKLETAKNALKKIASCRSNIEGDVVDIAQKALKEIE